MSTRSRSIIAVDENVRLLDQIATMLDASHRVLATSDPNRAVSWLKNDLSVCAVIAAESLRSPTGMEILSLAQELRPEARRILITNYGDLSSIVGKVHSGIVQRTISPPIESETLIKVIGTAPVNLVPHRPDAEAAA